MGPKELELTGLVDLDRPLSRWYADPLDRGEARALLERAQATLHKSLRADRVCVMCRLEAIVARHWLGRPIDRDYDLLVGLTGRTYHGRALTELIYGQLLISRKLSGAMDHLTQGFEIGRNLFHPEDFFRVRKRHKLLSRLAVGTNPAPPATLKELLTEAAVIQQLESANGVRLLIPGTRSDTLG